MSTKIFVFAVLIIASVVGTSLNTSLVKTRVFSFDKTATQADLNELQKDMLQYGIEANVTKLEYNEGGEIRTIEMTCKTKRSSSRFATDSFESVEIKKVWQALSVSLVCSGDENHDEE